MNLGKIKKSIFFVILFLSGFNLIAEEKITTVPLINLDNLKPSYEEEEQQEILDENKQILQIKEKKKLLNKSNAISVNILGLDKITAKTTKINI